MASDIADRRIELAQGGNEGCEEDKLEVSADADDNTSISSEVIVSGYLKQYALMSCTTAILLAGES